MTDKILAILSLICLTAFCGVIVRLVPEADLAIVTIIVLTMAIYDFYRTAFRGNGGGE